MIISGLIFSTMLSKNDYTWSLKRIKLFQFFNEKPFSELSFGVNFNLKLINFSFVLKLFYFAHKQAWCYKRWTAAMQKLQITWLLTLATPNQNTLHSLIIWKLAKLIILGPNLGLLVRQSFMSQIYWKKRFFTWHPLIPNEKLFLLPFILNEKNFLLSELWS